MPEGFRPRHNILKFHLRADQPGGVLNMGGKPMKIITTNVNKDQYWEERTAAPQELSCMQAVNIYPEIKLHKIRGFGGAFTESAAYCYSKLPEDEKKAFIKAYFSKAGLGYTLGRTHINSCDFSLSNYAADTDPQDEALEKFSLEREEQYILPLINAAREECGGNLKFLLSPWSPPAFMKTNHEMNHGGALKEEYYERWAKYMVRFVKEYEDRGIRVNWITVQNEPDAVQTWDSCKYTAAQEGIFAGKYLGPALKAAGLSHVKIFVWDHNKECAYERACGSMAQEGAKDYIAGIGVHWYTGDHFENIDMIRRAFPDLEVFFTEGCVEYSRFDRSNETYKGEMYAHDMIGNFKNGVSAFFDWNLLLDSQGGPNHVGNFCDAPMMCTEDFSKVEKHLSYYYIGHFSRYVQPGAFAVPVSSWCSEAECAGFVNPDGEKVLILLNRQDKVVHVSAGAKGQGASVDLEPHSIVTLCWE